MPVYDGNLIDSLRVANIYIHHGCQNCLALLANSTVWPDDGVDGAVEVGEADQRQQVQQRDGEHRAHLHILFVVELPTNLR